MAKTLAIIHTTPVTVSSLKELVAARLPGVTVMNFLDDSILPELTRNGGNVDAVAPRWFQYVRIADQLGADVILSACSSVGELAWRAREHVRKPVLRIDEPMAERAVAMGTAIGVVATVGTTLRPTERLLHVKAAEIGKPVQVIPVLASEAYQRLMAGDAAGHDKMLLDTMEALAERVDVVVLAQASMARVVPQLSASVRSKVLASPELGIEGVREALKSAAHSTIHKGS
ncbi:MAG: aspartate/glutamate racemase family protein [Alicyclobacillus sp.]|nr:aspartate/glutamate racemase family protein [Alicyclobacillus sp.]